LSEVEDHLKQLICAAQAGDPDTCRRFLHDVGSLLRSYYAHRFLNQILDVGRLSTQTAGELAGHSDHQDAIARRDVERLLARLPQRTRALMKGVKFDGLSTAEAAAHTRMSESAVKVTVHRAMKHLAVMARGELAS
jgi:RNA polymerase sigma-70 factor (ECF subfamily)